MGGKGSGRKKSKTMRLSPQAKKIMSDLGRIGGNARADNLSPERRREIAVKASKAAARARTQKAKERQGTR
jgi:hypothetical protein